MGQTSRSLETRLKEHRSHVKFNRPEKSAIAEHQLESGHKIEWDKATILHSEKNYKKRLILESIEIKKNKPNFNRDDAFPLNKAWNLFLSPRKAGKKGEVNCPTGQTPRPSHHSTGKPAPSRRRTFLPRAAKENYIFQGIPPIIDERDTSSTHPI